MQVAYKGQRLAATFKADFLCFDTVIVELKAQPGLTAAVRAQIIHYLKASASDLGLLINFGAPRLEYRRFIGPG